ncbi:acyl-ACP--UDP-N- acetylglucosamine O-acyltransferase [Rhodococcus sp. WMMA185]|uniref:DapH/DapD/GlmU-related protein n=1 Tax=Rhodococcus sp. WMMA185 TaxID=679318 RepID=UPI0008789E58|nr:DapH/DapD/GlmU-related protein [Rhodococcus sp. WMMA185]AOW93768.1 acyl-ACP--UDP-N- acetylglucosamine O-acyltransferase [Rhodococcus sp. WMMA185]
MPIGDNCEIHPTVVIGDEVTIGNRVSIGPYAVLTGPLDIGDDCWIGAHATLGAPPEWIGKVHPRTWAEASPHKGVVIGAGTVIREMTAVHQGAERTTRIGRGGFIMNRISVAHDVQIGDDCVIAPSTTFGGHVTMGDGVNLGMNAVIHQRRVIGDRAMVGMGTVVAKDIPPFATVFGNPAVLRGTNRVGMARIGIAEADIAVMEALYDSANPGAHTDLPESLADAFARWRGLAIKPLVSSFS